MKGFNAYNITTLSPTSMALSPASMGFYSESEGEDKREETTGGDFVVAYSEPPFTSQNCYDLLVSRGPIEESFGINKVAWGPLLYRPIALHIGSDRNRFVWVRAWIEGIKTLLNGRLPEKPLLVPVLCTSLSGWDCFVIEGCWGSATSFHTRRHRVYVGGAHGIYGLYKLLAAIQTILEWSLTDGPLSWLKEELFTPE